MFGKKKRDDGENSVLPPPESPEQAWQVLRREPTFLEQLRDRRIEKVKAANDLDREIAGLDAEITWLERHPQADEILRAFLAAHKDDARQPSAS